MRNALFLCIDVGTSSVKAAVFTHQKLILDFIKIPLPPDSPNTPQHWIEALTQIISEFHIYIAPEHCRRVIITVSGHGPSTVYLDQNGKVLHYTSWMRNETVVLKNEKSLYLPQIAYVRNNLEEVYRKTATVLGPAEYISFLLSKKKFIFVPNKRLLPYFWTEQNIEFHRINPVILPAPIPVGGALGRCKSSFARKLKLKNGFIVSGGLDYLSAIIGAGNMKPANIVFRCGSSATFNVTHPADALTTIKNERAEELSFNLPSFLNKYNNIGVTVPHFDALYKKVNSHIKLQNVDCNTIISQMNAHTNKIVPPLDPLMQKIVLNSKINMNEIDFFISQKISAPLLGYAYLALLFDITKYARNHIVDITKFHKPYSAYPGIMLSGGHAYDHTFMQLLAVYLKTNIFTFEPVYAELYGNLALGLHAVSSENPISIFSDYPPIATIFSPQ